MLNRFSAVDLLNNLKALNGGTANDTLIATVGGIINAIIAVIGVVAVIMLVIAGFRYTVSGGDAKAVETAKNQIMYAIIGIVICVLAFAIVTFVVNQLNAVTK